MIACAMTAALATIIFIWLVVNLANGATNINHYFTISILSYLSHIHLLAILGRCSEMSVCEFPPISRFFSRHIVSKFRKELKDG